VLGPILFVALLLLPAPEGLPAAGWRTAAVGVLMATWWLSEAVPLAVTALLPIVLFPLLGVATTDASTAPYANPVIFLFLGGFLVALALESTGLHRRAALFVLSLAGPTPSRLILGYMVITAVISMWVSNTATTVMMLPMALAILALRTESGTTEGGEGGSDVHHNSNDHFAPALLLGIAYAATIGGLGTLIGTPPNALFAAYLRESHGIRVGFAEWMVVALPVVVIALPITWWLLTRVLHRLDDTPIAGGAALIARERAAQGVMTRGEWFVGAVTTCAALLWMTRPLFDHLVAGVSDAGIAIAAAVVLFAVPVGIRPWRTVIQWHHATRLPWGVLLLFGGGLSLASAIQASGLAEWIGQGLGGVMDWPLPVMLVMLVAVVIVLSEFASNTAITAAFLPIVASVAVVGGGSPVIPALAAAMAASGGFAFPVSTPPNAIVYGTGRITVPQMVRSGALLDLLFVVLLPPAVIFIGARVFS
jgi:sodium-dependent dicarboxylate transporter 2/3/5